MATKENPRYDNLNKETKTRIGEEASSWIGTYDESTGGGDVLKKGEKFLKADSPEEAEELREENPGKKVRVMQPRNPDGTFGYNSQNARELKYKNSRGKTVPHFLRGIELTCIEKGSTMKMLGEKGIKYYISTIGMTAEELVENCKEFIKAEKGFKNLHEGMIVGKKGKPTKAEKKAKLGATGRKVDVSKLSQKTQQKIAQAETTYMQKFQQLRQKYPKKTNVNKFAKKTTPKTPKDDTEQEFEDIFKKYGV